MKGLVPRISLIVEWDNPRATDGSRAHRMLRRVADQITETKISGELILVYDELEVRVPVVQAAADIFQERVAGDFPVKLVATRGLRYYQLKNEGARYCTGEIVILVDSDVIPEDGWLVHLVGSFDDPKVQVVNGATYVDLSTIHGKGFGLHWYMFDPRTADGPIYAGTDMWANSLGFRREIIERFPFPRDPERFRGQCGMLARTLQANGIDIYQHPMVRVAHPAPPARKFLQWSLCNGHDQWVRLRRMGDRRKYGFWGMFRQWLRNLKKATITVVRDRARVDLPLWGVPIVLAIAYVYYTLVSLGGLIAAWRPDLLRKRYGI
jgi:glycosyltransferase involved in cell wall biosynthesis